METQEKVEIVSTLSKTDTVQLEQVVSGAEAYKDVAEEKNITQTASSQNKITALSNTNNDKSVTVELPYGHYIEITPDVKIHFPEVETELKREVFKMFKGNSYHIAIPEKPLVKITEDITIDDSKVIPQFEIVITGNKLYNVAMKNGFGYETLEMDKIIVDGKFPREEIENEYTNPDILSRFKSHIESLSNYLYSYLEMPPFEKVEGSYFQDEGESDEDFEKRIHKLQKEEKAIVEAAEKKHLETARNFLYDALERFVEKFTFEDNTESRERFLGAVEQKRQKLNDFTEFEGVHLPLGYSSNGRDLIFTKTIEKKDGTSKEIKTVMGTLCTITEISHTDDGKPCYVVAYVDNGKVKKLVATQKQLFSSKGLETLQDDILMKGNCLSDYIDYFKLLLSKEDEYLSEGCKPSIKQGYVTSICGWKDGDFVIGDTTIGKSGKHYKFADKKAARSMKPSGSLAGWATGYNYIGNQPVVQYKMCVGLSVPLLRILNLPSSTCNHTGYSTTGKTTSAKAVIGTYANPIITDPDTVIINANAGIAALEPHLQTFTDLVTATDENCLGEDDKNGKKKGNSQKNIAYTIPQGQGRPRSNGGKYNLPICHWRTKMLTTGEHITIDETVNAGQIARITEFDITMPTNLGYEVSRYEEYVEVQRNFAWLQPYYIKVVICYGDDNIRKLYERVFVEFDSTDPIKRRSGRTYALEAMAGLLFNATCDYIYKSQGIYIEKIPDPIGLVKEFAGNSYENIIIVPEEVRALKAVFDDLFIHRNGYDGSNIYDHRGYYKDGDKELLVVPKVFDEIINGANLHSLDMKRKLKAMNLTSCDGRNMDKPRTRWFANPETQQLEPVRERFICIDYKKADELVNGVISKEEMEASKKEYMKSIQTVDIPEMSQEEKDEDVLTEKKHLDYWNATHPDKQESEYKYGMTIFYRIQCKDEASA